MKIVRFAAVAPTPWRNGGGITYELWREPSDGAGFRRRLSVAEVATSAPFSDFSGYRRRLVLLEGAGMDLDFGNGEIVGLNRPGDDVLFDGARPVHGRLRDGATHDLNWFEASRIPESPTQILSGERPHAFPVRAGRLRLLFCGGGAWRLRVAGQEERLDRWDLATFDATDEVRLEPLPCASPAAMSWIWLAEPLRSE